MHAAITAIAHFVPPQIRSNGYFAERLETSDEWIRTRTGIVERRISERATSDLIEPAARQCLAQRGLSPADIDCIVVATMTPDRPCPSTAAIVQKKLGARHAWGFDVGAACSGFLFGLVAANGLIASGAARRVLLCAGERMTSITNPDDRQTAMLFGDAGTAAIVEHSPDARFGLLDSQLWMDGTGEGLLTIPAGGSALPATAGTVAANQHCLRQDGQSVFRSAVQVMSSLSGSVLARSGQDLSQVDWFVPHQANLRIVDAVHERVGIPAAKVMTNLQRFGNTASASIPLCLSEWFHAGQLRRGHTVLLTAFGAGFTAGAVYLRWAVDLPPTPAVTDGECLTRVEQ